MATVAKKTGLYIRNEIKVGRLKGVSAKAFKEGQIKAAIQMLDWMSSGNVAEQAAPPIRTGVLASSGSAFYKKENIAVSPDISGGKGTPNKRFNARNITWGFNTTYAAAMHEGHADYKDGRGHVEFSPGPYSQRNPNRHPGNQWLLKHLKKNKNNYTKLVAEFAKRYF